MKGQTIIEVVVALTTAVIIISAISLAVLTALRNAEYSAAQNTASRYAQEGIEFLRFMRDANFPKFKQFATTNVPYYCLGKGSSILTPAPVEDKDPCSAASVILDGIYARRIIFNYADPYCAPLQPPTPAPTIANTSTKVTVTVSWTDGKCPDATPCHEAKAVSCLSDYTLVPTIPDLPTPTPNP